MRKLQLQMHISLNGYVSSEKGDTGFNWDTELREFSIANLEDVDTILLGSHTAPDLITYWGKVAKDTKNKDHLLGKRITEIPKIVFSQKITSSLWQNTMIINGSLKNEIGRLKKMPGKNMLVYGGADFVSALIKEGLIDEYCLLVNPVVIDAGLTIFNKLEDKQSLKLLEVKQFTCGTVLLKYSKSF